MRHSFVWIHNQRHAITMQQNWMQTLSFLFSIKYDEISNKFILDDKTPQSLPFQRALSTADCLCTWERNRQRMFWKTKTLKRGKVTRAWESHESVGIFNKQLNKWKWMSSATFTTTIAKLQNSRLKLGKFSGRIYSCTRIEIVFQPVFEKCGKYILLSNYIHSES